MVTCHQIQLFGMNVFFDVVIVNITFVTNNKSTKKLELSSYVLSGLQELFHRVTKLLNFTKLPKRSVIFSSKLKFCKNYGGNFKG